MQKLSPTGEHAISELAQRHGFSHEAVMSLLESVLRGNGTMAQFNHPEFGGSGQWMGGGMIMVSDMFNHSLKGRIADLASELARLVASDHWQGRTAEQEQHGSGPAGRVSLFVPAPGSSAEWWPAALGTPASHGTQNGVRYAYFAAAQRLAIELNGKLTLYDTLDHQLGGFSQQQSRGGSLSFHSQHGLVDLAELPVVSADEEPQHVRQSRSGDQRQSVSATSTQSVSSERMPNALATIEKLAELHAKGILNDEEFAAKKAELLRRV
jgi:hypothetical protein